MSRRTIVAALSALIAAGASSAAAQDVVSPESKEEIVVHGDLPRCRVLANDPLDAVDVSGAAPFNQVIKPDPVTGTLGLSRDDDPFTALPGWDRAGTWLGDYVYRAPTDGNPLCIGSSRRYPRGWGQLRRVVDATPYQGKYVRFTCFVATRRSYEVRFWLAAGDSRAVMKGGDTSSQPLSGTTKRGWVPVMLTMGPVPEKATKLSYGFLLMGAGDVWVTSVNLEVVDDAQPAPEAGNMRPAGRRPRP